ncbi:MAG: VOC family protein [Spirochaetia bacterium]|nr:VOC family protein [Spirochaetia bacterium]
MIRRGDVFWTELNTSNPDAGLKFYQKLFGWSSKPMPMGPDMTYNVLVQNGKEFGGVLKTQDPAAPSTWLSYFWVDSVDQATETAKQLGGTVLMPPGDIPGTGRMSVIQDPTGASFALFHSDNARP